MTRPLRFTPQQRAILDADSVSVAVSAGAGCGKTFVLTQRFLAFLDSEGRDDPLSKIVAITFTEKAAREMRDRVRAACQDRLLGCEPDRVGRWLAVLRGLDSARITTIHAYCATLLRTYAVEAGLDPGFELLDPSFGDTFVRRSVQDAVCRLLQEGDGDAAELVLRFGFERAVSLVRELLDGFRVAEGEAIGDATPESLDAAWRAVWAADCVPRLIRGFRDSSAARRVTELLGAYETTNAVMAGRRSAVLELLAREEWHEPTDLLEALCEQAQVKGGGAKSAWPNEAVYQDVMAALKTLRENAKELIKQLKAGEAVGVEAATLALVAHRVARAVGDGYARRKRDEGRLDFDDLLCLTRDLLRDHAGVRRRASGGIELLMVDEFQDTDPVQAELVRLLCGEAMTAGKLFLVGDAKQSIYRFRRADPRVFSALRAELPEAGRLALTTNFRSQPAILRFVNFSFAAEMPDYEPLEPVEPVQRSPEPSVEFLFATAGDDEDSAEGRRRQEARWIAKRLSLLFADETPRVRDAGTGELRRVRAGDVAILFRALSDVHLYEQALLERQIDYYLAGGRAFFAQQEIYDVSHLCRWLDDPSDELSLAGVLRSPWFGLSDDTLYALKPERGGRLFDGLSDPPPLPEVQGEQVRRARDVLAELRGKKDRLPLAALLTLAIERTGYDAALLCEHLGVRKLANLRKLVGLARGFDAAGPHTLSDFAFRLREAVREQADAELAVTHPEVGDVVRLMTVHQSKGLEFPVVVVADMDRSRSGGESRATYHPKLGPLFPMPDEGDERPPHLGLLIHRIEESREEEAELARVLYVAVTRAQDHLILSAGLERDGRPRSPWLKLLARRFDLTTGLPALNPYLGTSAGSATAPRELPQVHVWHAEPAPPGRGTKSRTDHGPLRSFREQVESATPSPLPPLIGRIEADPSTRDEFSVADLCAAVRGTVETAERPTEVVGGPNGSFRDGRLPFDEAPPRAGDYAKLLAAVLRAALERLDFAGALNAAAVSAAVDRGLSSQRREADASLRRRIIRKLTDFLASPTRSELAAAQRVTQAVEFRLRWGRPEVGRPAEVTGTIDCLFQDAAGRWRLVEYAAAEEADADDAGFVADRSLRLAIKAAAVERLFGEPPAAATLVQFGPPTRVNQADVTPATLDEAARRIDDAIRTLRGTSGGAGSLRASAVRR